MYSANIPYMLGGRNIRVIPRFPTQRWRTTSEWWL